MLTNLQNECASRQFVVTFFAPEGTSNVICLFFVRLKVFFLCLGRWQFFGGAELSTALFAWSLFMFMELNATCACEKDSVVMLFFLSSGLDSTK